MYEHLDTLAAGVQRAFLLKDLRPLETREIDQLASRWPDLPREYLEFLRERGAGRMEAYFNFLHTPLDARTEVFYDRLIFERGAKGDVVIFGYDQSEGSYGFDTGDRAALVEVNAERHVTPLSLSFRQFVEKLIAGYPRLPGAGKPY